MGQVMKNLDILRLSLTFLAFATVVFILATSWTVFQSHGDQASCQKLLESAREIKDSLQRLNIDEEGFSRDLETVQGQKSELLRAIIESDLEGSRSSNSMQVHMNDHEEYSRNRIPADRNLVDGPSNLGETGGFHEIGKIKVCVFGKPDLPSQVTRDIRCPRLNTSVELVHSLNVTDIHSADVTLFRNTQQKFGWWQTLLKERNKHQRWGLLSMIPPTGSAKYTSLPKAFRADTFHWTVNYNHESDIPLPFGIYNDRENDSGELPNFFDKTKLVAYIASDCDQEKWPRSRFVSVFQTYADVEVFGCVSCNLDCQEKLKKFKFILALESTPCRGYITEVFWSALADYQSVPIVWGAQPTDYQQVAPNHSYIEVTQFDSVQSLARYIKKLSESPDEYRQFHTWRTSEDAEVLVRMKDTDNVPFDSHICSVVDKYLDNYNKKVTLRDTNRNDWLGTCSIRPNDIEQNLPIPSESENV